MAKIMREYSDDEVLGAVRKHDTSIGYDQFKKDDVEIEVHPRRDGGHRVTITYTFDFDGTSLPDLMDEQRIEAAGYRKR